MARDSHVRDRVFFAHSDPHVQRYSIGDSLLACLMMICSNGPSLDQKEEVEKFLLAVVARFKVFKKRVPSNSFVGQRPQCASASKAKSSVLSELSGLENVLFNDFIDDELDSEDVSEQKASASVPNSVPVSRRRSVLHVKKMRWLRSMLSGFMRQTQL
jgi:hypothetical protein